MAVSDRQPERLIRLGLILGPHGLRGELCFRPDLAGSETVYDQHELYLTSGEGRPVLYELERARPGGSSILVKLKGIDDREGAERVGRCVLSIPRDALPEPEEGEYYLADLLGLTAIDRAGELLGRVESVLETGAVPVLEIVSADGALWQVPLAAPFVDEIDLAGGRIKVEPVERSMPKEREERER